MCTFVNDALIACSLEFERARYEAIPASADDRALALHASASFVGDDDEDWDALFPAIQ